MRERQVQIRTESSVPGDKKLKDIFTNHYSNVKDIEIDHDKIESGRINIVDLYIKQENVEEDFDKDYYDEHMLLRRKTDISPPFSVNGWENKI